MDVDLTDNRTVRGVFYTATPFKGEEFKLVVKCAREYSVSALCFVHHMSYKHRQLVVPHLKLSLPLW